MQPLQMWFIPVAYSRDLARPADLMIAKSGQHIHETRPGVATTLRRFHIL